MQHVFFNDEKIHSLQNIYGITLLTPSEDPFFSLIESIISQQLSVKASNTIVQRFLDLFEHRTVTAQSLARIPLETLRHVGMSWNKAHYVNNIASAVLEGSLDFEKMKQLSDEDVITELTKIKGIGRWTAEMFLMFSLARPDVMSYGDIGLQNAIQKLYGYEQKPTKQQMEEVSSNWKPFRTYACRLLWKLLDNEPR